MGCLFSFIVIAAGATGAFLLASGVLAHLLLPGQFVRPALFSILAAVILTHSASCFIPTMADFVGGLRQRIVFLSLLAIVQIPVLWVFVRCGKSEGPSLAMRLCRSS